MRQHKAMPRTSHTLIVLLFSAGLIGTASFLSCIPQKAVPPLTEAESHVFVVHGGQEISLSLYYSCTSVGKVDAFPCSGSDDPRQIDGQIKQSAYGKNANVVQLLRSWRYPDPNVGEGNQPNVSGTCYMRYWLCPQAIIDQLGTADGINK